MADICEVTLVNQKNVEFVKKNLKHEPITMLAAEMFKALADPTRLRIIEALSIRELCVCDLSFLLGMTQSAISHQLRILRQARILRYRKDGRVVYYSLDDEHISGLVDAVFDHVSH